jgi:hypothetical protein
MMWIITQLNSNEDLIRDSFVIRQLLIKAAQIFHTAELDINVKIQYEGGEASFKVDKTNLKQKFEIPANTRHISFFANGVGFTNFEFVYSYATFVEDFSKTFSLDVEPELMKNETILHLKVCTQQNTDEENEDDGEENRDHPIMEINLPKGFVSKFILFAICHLNTHLTAIGSSTTSTHRFS